MYSTQLPTDLQLIPLNTLFPPQFFSVLKVLRYLIVPENSNTLQLNLSCAWIAHFVAVAKLLLPFAEAVNNRAALCWRTDHFILLDQLCFHYCKLGEQHTLLLVLWHPGSWKSCLCLWTGRGSEVKGQGPEWEGMTKKTTVSTWSYLRLLKDKSI